MQQTINTQDVVADFFANGYRVSGAFSAGTRNLSDAVFDPNTSYLLITDAYLNPITDPATLSAYYKTMLLTKPNLDFLLTMNSQDAIRQDQRFRTGKTFDVSIAMTVPFFELQGKAQTISSSFNPRSFLSNEAGAFITLMDVTASCTFHPEIQYHGGAAIVNREKVCFLGETSKMTS